VGTVAQKQGSQIPYKAVRQYDICWANLPKPIGRRPVLLLTRTAAYAYLNKIVVSEITSTVRAVPQEVSVGEPEGLKQPSVVNLDNIHIIPKTLIGERLGALGPNRTREIKRALGYVLDWPELKVL
jgi:mRNA interferase MazF